MPEQERLTDHSGEPASNEVIAQMHSHLHATWFAHKGADQPHTIYRQSYNDECYICTALRRISEIEAELARTETELADTRRYVESWSTQAVKAAAERDALKTALADAQSEIGVRMKREAALVAALSDAGDALSDCVWIIGEKPLPEPPLPAPDVLVLERATRVVSEAREVLSSLDGEPA